jgi:hypothetical protein
VGGFVRNALEASAAVVMPGALPFVLCGAHQILPTNAPGLLPNLPADSGARDWRVARRMV